MLAGEVFVVQLARASRRANRFIRKLPREAREDVLAAALLWCWENREKYSLTTTLETWFVNAVRDAYKAWGRGERRNRSELVEEMRANDDPAWAAILEDAVRELVGTMDEADRAIVRLLLEGRYHTEIAAQLTISRGSVEKRLARMRSYIPRGAHEGVMLRRAVTPAAPEYDEADEPRSQIDRELEKLDLPPEHGKDCPPCWRCKWFEGYLPDGSVRSVRAEVVEPEVREAISRTEARKIEIAERVRAGQS